MTERGIRWGPGLSLDGGAVTLCYDCADLESSPSSGWKATYAAMHVSEFARRGGK